MRDIEYERALVEVDSITPGSPPVASRKTRATVLTREFLRKLEEHDKAIDALEDKQP